MNNKKIYVRYAIQSKLKIFKSKLKQISLNFLEKSTIFLFTKNNFTNKIEGLKKLNYHERLERLGMYSMERRRERYLIINSWQQIENVKENILKLERENHRNEEGTLGRRKCIKSPTIPSQQH